MANGTQQLTHRKLILALAGVVLVLLTYPRFSWSVRPEHFFRADDWDWLFQSAFVPLGSFIHFWPRQIYNDRAVGALLITAVHRVAGLDNVIFHGLWVGIHLLNTLLLFALGVRLLRSMTLAWVGAYAFGNWTASTQAVTWVAAVFDLFAATLVLASVLMFLSSRAWVRMLSPVFYFLAMRTKENVLLLPLLLLLYVLWDVPRKDWLAECMRRLRWHLALLGIFIVTYGYFYLFQYLPQLQPTDPYLLRFDAATLAKSLSYYLRAMLYRVRPFSPLSLVAGALVLLLAISSPKGRTVALGAAGFLLFLLPVLFLPHHPDPVYLYLPSVFFALCWVGLAQRVLDLLPKPRLQAPLAAALALSVFLALPHRAAARQYAQLILAQTSPYKQQLEQFRQRFPSLKPDAAFAFVGFPRHFNVFDIGPCYSIKLSYGDPSLSCTMLGDNIDDARPAREGTTYVVLRAGRLEFQDARAPR